MVEGRGIKLRFINWCASASYSSGAGCRWSHRLQRLYSNSSSKSACAKQCGRTGEGMASEGSGNFYAYPAPRISINSPSVQGHKPKEEFEKMLKTWFV